MSCSFSDDRAVLVCWRGNGGADAAGWRHVGPASSGSGSVYVRGDGPDALRATLELVESATLSGSAVWAVRAERWQHGPDVDERRRRLAAELGVSHLSLAALSVGWKPDAYGVGAWTYPQRSAAGAVVSVGLRIDRPADRQRFDSDGGKTKSPAGLIYIPGRWLTGSGPVCSVEGMSDVAALDTLGIDAVGHGGNAPAGAVLDELERILRTVPADRDILAVAERDPGREDDPDSPGKSGARRKAQALANRLDRRVGVVLPPDAAKDSRAWLQAAHPAGGHPDAATRAALAERFLAGALAGVVWYLPEPEPPAPPHRVEPLPPVADELELEDYRQRMRERLQEWSTDAPGKPRGRVGLLAAPAGSGKTTAVDELAVPAYELVASGIPTHANVAERREALLRLPVIQPEDVAAFPKLSADNCASFTDEQADELRAQGHRSAMSAARAQGLGFGIRGTACRGCPLAPWRPGAELDDDLAAFSPERLFDDDTPEPPAIRCAYWRDVERARAARVRLATLDRVRLSAASLVDPERRSLITLDERGFETLFPAVTVDVGELEHLVDTLSGAADRLERERPKRRRTDDDESGERRRERIQRDADRIEHVRQLAAVAAELVERLEARRAARTFGAVVVDIRRERSRRKPTGRETLIVRGRTVKQPARLLADALERSMDRGAVPPAQALELVRRIHAGTLDRLVLHVEELDGGDGSRVPVEKRRTWCAAIGTWETKLPADADLLVLDGTADADALADRLGRPIDQIAPPAKIRRRSPAVQLPRDIDAGTSPAVVARALEQALRAIPDSCRVGVILLKVHRDKLFPVDRDGNDVRTDWSREHVPDDVLARIARDEDGRLLVEHYAGGRDRASNVWIDRADGLVLLGTRRPPSSSVVQELARRREDDALEAGSPWGRVDWEARTVDGRIVRCRGRGYVDERWARAARAVTLAGLLQALERARTVLPAGVDADGRPGGLPVVVVSSEPGLGIPVVDTLPDPVSPGARRVAAIVAGILRGTNVVPSTGQDRESGERSTCATGPIEHHGSYIEPVAQVGAPARSVLEALTEGAEGPAVPTRTARRWIAEAAAAGLITRTGSTRATVYGLPDFGPAPPPLVDQEPDRELDDLFPRPSPVIREPEPWPSDPPDPPPAQRPHGWPARSGPPTAVKPPTPSATNAVRRDRL